MTNRHLSGNEKGNAVVIAMMVLALLTVIGIAATNTSTMEIQIAGNDRDSKRAFYVAESGWQVTACWLDARYPLITEDVGLENSGTRIACNCGKYDAPDEIPFGACSFKAKARFDGARLAVGYSTDFRRFHYEIDSMGIGRGNACSWISATVGKVDYVESY